MLSMAAVPLLVGGLSVGANAADGINILDNIKVEGQIRPRYEMVDDSTPNATKTGDKFATANAYTARTKLKATADLFGIDGLSTSIGVISVNNFGSHSYNAKDGHTYYDGSRPYAVVVDPQKAMISNAEINYKINKTLVHVGRGQVNLDNQRFIGTVGWRQLERSYDSVFIADSTIPNLNLLAAWVYGLQGVNAKDTLNANTVLLHASYKVADPLTITAYDYMIAADDTTPNAGGFGADTYGAALTGKIKTSGVALSYRAEYAVQKDATMKYQELPTDSLNGNYKADADYYNLDLGVNVAGVIAGANYEFMSGQDPVNPLSKKTAFQCPLGTNHKFNGWADKFLTTPSGGLQDANVRLGYKAKGFGKLLAVYHDFTSDTAMTDAYGLRTDDLGSEIDVLYANKIPGINGLNGLIKYADFSKGKVKGYNADMTKLWVQLDYKFSTK